MGSMFMPVRFPDGEPTEVLINEAKAQAPWISHWYKSPFSSQHWVFVNAEPSEEDIWMRIPLTDCLVIHADGTKSYDSSSRLYLEDNHPLIDYDRKPCDG